MKVHKVYTKSLRLVLKATNMSWRKPSKTAAFKLSICCQIASGSKAYFPTFRATGKWVTDERMIAGVLFSPAPQSGGTHYLLIHTRAASQFEEIKHGRVLKDNIIFILWLCLASYSPVWGETFSCVTLAEVKRAALPPLPRATNRRLFVNVVRDERTITTCPWQSDIEIASWKT